MVRSAVAIAVAQRASRSCRCRRASTTTSGCRCRCSTLGYETARHAGVGVVKSLMEDARTTGRWYLGVTMGRPTGHLTLGIGKAASATCTIIPEEFAGDVITLADIADIVEGSIIKRRAMGKAHGVVLLAEGAGRALQPARGRRAAGRRSRRAGQHPRHRDRPRPQGEERGADAARAARHQGDDRRQDDRLRAALRAADSVRRRVRARPRLRGGASTCSTAGRAR